MGKGEEEGDDKDSSRTKIVEICEGKRPPSPPLKKKEFWAKLEPLNKFSTKLEEERKKKKEKKKKRVNDKDAKKVKKLNT